MSDNSDFNQTERCSATCLCLSLDFQYHMPWSFLCSMFEVVVHSIDTVVIGDFFFIIIMWINYTSPYMGIKLTILVVIGTDWINITINFPSYFDTSLYTCLCTWKVNTFILKWVVVVAWLLDLQLPMQSVPITTNVVSLHPAQARCTRYNIMW